MANIVYADPFGSYVRGQQIGQQEAIQQGEAARQFRAQDLSPQVQAWYLPQVQREREAQVQSGELGLNEGLNSFYGRLALLGPEGTNAYLQNLARTVPGFNANNLRFNNEQDFENRELMQSGNMPPAFINPNVTMAGKYYTGRNVYDPFAQQNFEREMDLRYGPGWRNYGQGGAQQAQPQSSFSTGVFGGARGNVSPVNASPSPYMPQGVPIPRSNNGMAPGTAIDVNPAHYGAPPVNTGQLGANPSMPKPHLAEAAFSSTPTNSGVTTGATP